ncbi:MAG: MMPL family transporter, partial [Frankiaceae bacterium]|nr:MMPL family transporter [Frankiaceae bacterium]
MFTSIGQFVVARAKLVLVLSGVAIAGFAVLGIGVFGKLLNNGFEDPNSGSNQARAVIDQKFGGAPNILFLVHARSGTVDGRAAATSGHALADNLAQDPRISQVTS